MSRSKISFVSGILVPLLVVISTIALSFVLGDEGEKTTLFYFNLSYGVTLELLFFGYIRLVFCGSKNFTGAFYSIMGVMAAYYIALGFLVMISYSVFLSSIIPIKYYISATILITMLWLVVGSLVAETDSRHKEDESITKEKNKKLMRK